MRKHTPGPWEIEYDDLTEEWIVFWETGSAEVGGANAANNANLIAAAPEMYEALGRAYASTKYSGWLADSQLLGCIEKAIAKAKGQTQ